MSEGNSKVTEPKLSKLDLAALSLDQPRGFWTFAGKTLLNSAVTATMVIGAQYGVAKFRERKNSQGLRPQIVGRETKSA